VNNNETIIIIIIIITNSKQLKSWWKPSENKLALIVAIVICMYGYVWKIVMKQTENCNNDNKRQK
jgi:hypothetical protein